MGQADFYPQLLSDEISNYYGNRTYGFIFKKNLYNSLPDKLEDKVPNRPVNPLLITKRLLLSLNSIKPAIILQTINQINDEVEREADRIAFQLEEVADKDGSIRAEFRISFDRLASMAYLLSGRFGKDRIENLSIALPSEAVSDLGQIYLDMLVQPIYCRLADIGRMIEKYKFDDISSSLLTLCTFESLFTFVLFSGRFISYLNDFIFKPTLNTIEDYSLKLAESIIKFNHLVFPSELFDFKHLKLKCNSDSIYQRLLTKFGSDCQEGLDAISLVLDIRNPSFRQEMKGRMLWEAYFQEIPSEDFNGNNTPRWKYDSLNLNQPISFGKRRIALEDAVSKVFNRDCFDKPAWNKRYLCAFEQWITDYPNENHHSILIEAALDMGIGHIRYHSGFDSFFSHGKRYVFIGENPRINSKIISSKVNEAIEVMAKYKKKIENDGAPVLSRKKTKFTNEESISLVRGINFIGMGKWKAILTHPSLKFSNNRTNVDLKDRARNMEKLLRVIRIDGRSFQVLPGFEKQCIKPIDQVKHIFVQRRKDELPDISLWSSLSVRNHVPANSVDSATNSLATSKTTILSTTIPNSSSSTTFIAQSNISSSSSTSTFSETETSLPSSSSSSVSSISSISSSPALTTQSASSTPSEFLSRILKQSDPKTYPTPPASSVSLHKLRSTMEPDVITPSKFKSTAVSNQDLMLSKSDIKSVVEVERVNSNAFSDHFNLNKDVQFDEKTVISSIELLLLQTVETVYSGNECILMLERLREIPDNFDVMYRYYDIKRRIPGSLLKDNRFNTLFDRLVEKGLIVRHEINKKCSYIKRNY